MSGSSSAQLQLLEYSNISDYIETAATCLLLYDCLLTFEQEHVAVWMRRLSGANIICIFLWFITILYVLAVIVDSLVPTCEGFYVVALVCFSAECCMYLSQAMFGAICVYALEGCQFVTAPIVLLLGLVPFATNVHATHCRIPLLIHSTNAKYGMYTTRGLSFDLLSLGQLQIKRKETPISLKQLQQSQSLQCPLKPHSPIPPWGHRWKLSRSPSLATIQGLVGPARRLQSPPRLQSLTYVTPPPGFLQHLHRHHCSPPNKEVMKHLILLCYNGKTVIKCNCFISQLLIYWQINTALTTIELKVQIVLSLLDGDAHTWATPIFAQLVAVQVRVQGAVTPFADVRTFITAFKNCFGNLNDTAAAQVELSKFCTNKSMREKRMTMEFSALFKGPADCSGYGNLELHDKYLSGIPSHVYWKIELEMFVTWTDTDKHCHGPKVFGT
ncbi:predicted protein [Postia placenta Mad-698-R]|nr:predicted protein [Postia placenta Mad-698-R]